MSKIKPRRNTSALPPLTPDRYDSLGEFNAAQQRQLAELSARLVSIESRYNGQQRHIAEQSKFIDTLKTEGAELRKRVKFLENAAKLSAGPR